MFVSGGHGRVCPAISRARAASSRSGLGLSHHSPDLPRGERMDDSTHPRTQAARICLWLRDSARGLDCVQNLRRSPLMKIIVALLTLALSVFAQDPDATARFLAGESIDGTAIASFSQVPAWRDHSQQIE